MTLGNFLCCAKVYERPNAYLIRYRLKNDYELFFAGDDDEAHDIAEIRFYEVNEPFGLFRIGTYSVMNKTLVSVPTVLCGWFELGVKEDEICSNCSL